MLLVACAALSLGACAKLPYGAANGANAEEAADNIELTPDNLEAVADTSSMPEVQEPAAVPGSQWAYDESTDEMRGAKRKIARLAATSPLNLSFPYGETTPILTIRKDPKFGFNIYISSEGQPLCRSYNDDTVSVKFDDGPVREWSCSEAEDGSPGIVFFNREQGFIAAVKKAKRLVVELNYYDAGRQQISFPVEGLKW